jgi:hypothetical protein
MAVKKPGMDGKRREFESCHQSLFSRTVVSCILGLPRISLAGNKVIARLFPKSDLTDCSLLAFLKQQERESRRS